MGATMPIRMCWTVWTVKILVVGVDAGDQADGQEQLGEAERRRPHRRPGSPPGRQAPHRPAGTTAVVSDDRHRRDREKVAWVTTSSGVMACHVVMTSTRRPISGAHQGPQDSAGAARRRHPPGRGAGEAGPGLGSRRLVV